MPEQVTQEQTTQEQKIGQRLILKDGTTIEDGTCGYADGHLWCWLPGFTMQEAAQIFFDPEKTGRITFEYGEFTDVYEEFTVCTNLFVNADKIDVCLIRG